MKTIYVYTYNIICSGGGCEDTMSSSHHGAVELDGLISSKEEYLQLVDSELLKITKEHINTLNKSPFSSHFRYHVEFTSTLTLLTPNFID